MDMGMHVALIGADIQDNLMKGVDPIGKELRVDGVEYTIVGLGKREGKTLGQSRDNWVLIPISTWQHQYGARQTIRIWGKANGVGQSLVNAMEQARVIMRARRHDRLGANDSFDLDTNQSFLSLWASISARLHLPGHRRHRHHEHHAGVGDGADAGDRHPQGAGRAQGRRPAPVPD
jgi:putative ABC transport system permease protein